MCACVRFSHDLHVDPLVNYTRQCSCSVPPAVFREYLKKIKNSGSLCTIVHYVHSNDQYIGPGSFELHDMGVYAAESNREKMVEWDHRRLDAV